MGHFNSSSYISCLLLCLTLLITGTTAYAQRKPNILFCIADDQSFPHAGIYGSTWIRTPAFDRVAREGLLFMKAYTPNAKCSPSRSCILTGRNSWQLEEAGNHVPYFPARFRTFAEALQQTGYRTGYTGKGWAPGEPGSIEGKKRDLCGPAYLTHKTTPPTTQISNIDYAANFKEFLSERPADEPFCFWYGGLEPHRRYAYGSGINQGNKSISDIPAVLSFWPDIDSVRTDMLDYAFEIEYFDKHLGQMLAVLEEMGELDHTIIVVTADNGMPFPRAKGHAYEYSNHLPLAIRWPAGIRGKGRVIHDFVSFIDFAPTFIEAVGLDAETAGMQPFTGKSLFPIFRRAADQRIENGRQSVLIGRERNDVGRPDDQGYPTRGIVTDRYLYLHNFRADRWPAGNPETGYLDTDGSPVKTLLLNRRNAGAEHLFWEKSFGKRDTEELYDIRQDPGCMNNLAAEPQMDAVRDSLKAALFSALTAEQDPRMLGKGEVFDQYEYANPGLRDFYNRYINQGEKIKATWVDPSDFRKP